MSTQSKTVYPLSTDQPAVCCCCTTYGRWTSVNRMLGFFKRQTYPNIWLLIYNTAPVPMECAEIGHPVVVVNSERRPDGSVYTNVGDVRKDALRLITSPIFCLFDDDDFYMPEHVERGVAGLLSNEHYRAWKPAVSLYSENGGQTFTPCSNNLEASVFARESDVRRLGFRSETGSENLAWYNGLAMEGKLRIEPDARATYAYVWGDKEAPHKQSGDMGNPSNFINHKNASRDFGAGKILSGDYDVEPLIARFEEARKRYGLEGKGSHGWTEARGIRMGLKQSENSK